MQCTFISTNFFQKTIKNSLLIITFSILIAQSSIWAEDRPASFYQEQIQNASEALAAGNKTKADFYLARYLAASKADHPTDSEILKNILKKRQLDPAALIPLAYDAEFLEWFEKVANTQWDTTSEYVDQALGSIELQNVSSKNYFLTVAAYPEIQSWYLTDESELPFRQMVLALGSGKRKPFLILERRDPASPHIWAPFGLNTQKRALHYLWKPEFEDLDGDGIPEVWIRYNLAWGNGFTQFLDIYSIQEDGLKLFKQFRGENEGVARRLPGNRVEVGRAYGSHPDFARRDYDKHTFDIYEFQKGAFKKTRSYDSPHILRSKEWKRYYLV